MSPAGTAGRHVDPSDVPRHRASLATLAEWSFRLSPRSPLAASADEWATLSPEAKRERLLTAAAEVFARQGLDAPMSEVAEAAGSGVASIYRRFASKHELLAALVVQRMDQITRRRPGGAPARRRPLAGADRDAAHAGRGPVRRRLPRRGARRGGRPRRRDPRHPARHRRARPACWPRPASEGRLRADATTLDVRLLFAATRAARQVEPEHWPRMLELLIDALDSQPGSYEAPTPRRR